VVIEDLSKPEAGVRGGGVVGVKATRSGRAAGKQQQAANGKRKLIFKRNFSDESSEDAATDTTATAATTSAVGATAASVSTAPGGKVKVSVKLPVVESEETSGAVKQASEPGPGTQEFNSDSIHRVYEKTKLLIRNFYKNFDLLNENQQKLESQIALEQGATTEARLNSIQLQQARGKEINSILTNTPYTPHWFNIATMGPNNNK